MVMTIREYDTNKPIDSTTGTPPLKREITQSKRRTDSGHQMQTGAYTSKRNEMSGGQLKKQQIDTATLQEDDRRHENTEEHIKFREKRNSNGWWRILCAATILWVCIWFGWKFKR